VITNKPRPVRIVVREDLKRRLHGAHHRPDCPGAGLDPAEVRRKNFIAPMPSRMRPPRA
jgi:hypothetical protein